MLETSFSIFIFIIASTLLFQLNEQWICQHRFSKSILEQKEIQLHRGRALPIRPCRLLQTGKIHLRGFYDFESKRQ